MEALFAYVAMPMWQNFAEKKNGYEGIDVTGLEITSICCQGTIQHIFFFLTDHFFLTDNCSYYKKGEGFAIYWLW